MSCQVEYKYLAHLTGRKVYFDRVERIMDLMNDADLEEDRFPTKWLVTAGKPTNGMAYGCRVWLCMELIFLHRSVLCRRVC